MEAERWQGKGGVEKFVGKSYGADRMMCLCGGVHSKAQVRGVPSHHNPCWTVGCYWEGGEKRRRKLQKSEYIYMTGKNKEFKK